MKNKKAESKHGQSQTAVRNTPYQDTKTEDGASPNIATDRIMIKAAIDAHKQCNIATIDITSAYLHAYINKETLMLLKGHLFKLKGSSGPTNIPKICHL